MFLKVGAVMHMTTRCVFLNMFMVVLVCVGDIVSVRHVVRISM
jgi:hypothetical protein